jgi:hypothetical protein
MRKFLLLAVPATLLAGCASSNQGGVFAGRSGPDEFAVVRQAPLVVPPDFSMTPPRPGAPRPQEADSSTQALQAMFGGPAQRSASEQAVLGQAGATAAPAGVRSAAGDPATTVVNKGAVTRDILNAPAQTGAEATVSTPQ